MSDASNGNAWCKCLREAAAKREGHKPLGIHGKDNEKSPRHEILWGLYY